MFEIYCRTIVILNIIFLNIVHCSTIPQPSNSNETFQLQSNIQPALINNVNSEEQSAETEYDGDFIDYYQSSRDFNGNSGEFIESWPKELFGMSEQNGTILDEDIVEKILTTDSTEENNEITFEKMSQNEKAMLLELRKRLNLGTAPVQTSMIPPQFMSDLYQAVTDLKSGITIRNYPHGSSAVASILEVNPYIPGLFQFDLSAMSYEELMDAELHVYRIGIDASATINNQPYYLLRVYQVMPTDKHSFSLNPDVHQLLNVHYVSAFGTGWQVFKVKRAVESWKNGTSPNLGLLITATTILNEPVEIRFSRKHEYGDKFQPTLILFTNTVGRNITDYNENINTTVRQINTKLMQQSSPKPCSISSLYVDFAKIGWSQFIVSPVGFEAYQCSGACDWPMPAAVYNLTNHATVRNVLSHIGYDTSAACCVPTELDSITVLYVDDNGNFALGTLDNMVVQKCECH